MSHYNDNNYVIVTELYYVITKIFVKNFKKIVKFGLFYTDETQGNDLGMTLMTLIDFFSGFLL